MWSGQLPPAWPASGDNQPNMIVPRAFVGGMRGPHGTNATWPLAKLTIDPTEGVVVGLRRALVWLPFLRAMRYEWAELEHAEVVRGGLMGSDGIRFVGRTAPPVVFWTFRLQEVLSALAAAGVTVRRTDPPPRVWIRP